MKRLLWLFPSCTNFSFSGATAPNHSELMKAKVIVMPKETVLDPQGVAVRDAMHHLGFPAAREVRMGRYLEIEIDGETKVAEPKLRELCRDLLSNPVIEDFRLELPNE